jgi:hypothetical protein
MSRHEPIKKPRISAKDVLEYLRKDYSSFFDILKSMVEVQKSKEKDVYRFYLFCGETDIVYNYGCAALECCLRVDQNERTAHVRLYIGTIDDSEVEYVGPFESYEMALKRQEKALEVVKSWKGLLPKTMIEIEKVKLSKSEF